VDTGEYNNSFPTFFRFLFPPSFSAFFGECLSCPAPVCTGEESGLDHFFFSSFLLPAHLLLFSFLLSLRPGNSQRRTSSLHPRKIGALTRRELKLLPTLQSLYYDYYLPTIASVAPTQAELDQLLLDASAYIWIKYCRDGAQVFTCTDFRAAKATLEKHPSKAQEAAKTSARHQFDHFGDWTQEKSPWRDATFCRVQGRLVSTAGCLSSGCLPNATWDT